MSIYLNNGSSSFPKLPATHRALSTFVKEIGVVPVDYDSNSLTKKANEILLSARNGLASLLSVDSSSIFFAPNLSFVVEKLTDKILNAGDRIIMSAGDVASTSDVSDKLKSRGVEIIKIPLDKKFGVKPTQLKKISGAKALLFSHVNSITGATIPIDEIIKLSRKKDNPISILDISDSIGAMPINLSELDVDIAIFSTHKHLFGIGGVVGLYIKPDIVSRFLDFDKMYFEVAQGMTGIVSLNEGVNFVLTEDVGRIWKQIKSLRNTLQGVLEMCRRVEIIAPNPAVPSSILSFTISKHMPNTVAKMLEEQFGLVVGHGMCRNLGACKSLGIYPEGVLRVGLGFFNTISDVEYLGTSVDRIATESRKR